jgi:hypothetical protein
MVADEYCGEFGFLSSQPPPGKADQHLSPPTAAHLIVSLRVTSKMDPCMHVGHLPPAGTLGFQPSCSKAAQGQPKLHEGPLVAVTVNQWMGAPLGN